MWVASKLRVLATCAVDGFGQIGRWDEIDVRRKVAEQRLVSLGWTPLTTKGWKLRQQHCRNLKIESLSWERRPSVSANKCEPDSCEPASLYHSRNQQALRIGSCWKPAL